MSHSIENRYLGELRTHSTHLKSSDTIIKLYHANGEDDGTLAPAASPGSLSPPQDESPALSFFFQNGHLADKSTLNNLK